MKHCFGLMSAFLIAFGCGAPLDDADLDEVSQPLTSKTSALYAAGWQQSDMTQCMLAPGPNPCILPGRNTIRIKFIGADPCYSQQPTFTDDQSWHFQADRALRDSIPGLLSAGGWGNPFTVVLDDVNPSVTISGGTCPGSVNSNSMSSFVCVTSVGAPLVTVSEPLFGTYKRHDGVLAINIDIAKIRARVEAPITCNTNGDFHELLEHAAHIAALLPYGSGMYPVGLVPSGFPVWSSPVVLSGDSSSPYEAGGYPAGQLCRIGSYRTSMPTGQYIPSGTCAN